MRAHRMAVFGCTALLAITAAACGGNDDDNEPTGGSTPAGGTLASADKGRAILESLARSFKDHLALLS